MKISKKMVSLLLALVLVATVTGCGSKDTGKDNTPANTEKVLNFGCAMYTDGCVNPANDENAGWNFMRYGAGETLFKFDDNMVPQPWVAEKYDVNDEHTVWTITLKKGYKFSDGCDVTPTKVKEHIEWLRKEGPNGSAKPQKYLEFEAELIADDAANTLTIKTSKPYANLIGSMCHPTMGIVDVAHTKDFDNGTIGTGPYMIEKFNGVGVGYTMVKNPNYISAVPYDKINIYFMGDASAKTMALQSGQVDMVENITNVADLAKFDEDANFTVKKIAGVRTGFSWMNCSSNSILSNKTLRQAILMGIDYDAIANSKTIGGLYKAGFSVLPSSLDYGYKNLKNPYAYNPDAAKKLLDDAGIVDKNGNGIRELNGQDIVLRYISYENRLLNENSEAHMQYLNEIGIGTKAEFGSSDDQWSKLAALDYDINNNNWTTVGTGDPVGYMANWATATTYCGYSNPEYDKLYEELKVTMDPARIKEITFQLQQILVDDAVAIIDGYYSSSLIYSKNVGFATLHTADYYWISTEIKPAN
ncbi:MAG: ABC transporter substrate-binding protein [Clostridia bacterium]|nr:ABC transporter substrate-binding protein [Clostridia bacterium]